MTDIPLAVLGLPQDNNSSFLIGPALAPARIRQAFFSPSANLFSELGFELTSPEVWIDAGDVDLDGMSGEDAFAAIHDRVAGLLSGGHRVISLGGDHSVSFPAIHAHASAIQKLSVLHIDAHPDLYEDMDGNRYSHASPFARLMENGTINRLVQVGIRTLTAHQREQAQKYNVEIHEMRDLSRVSDIAFDGAVYLSLDLDAMDPAFVPGVSHHEPGGLSVRDVLNIVHSFNGQLIGADLVELNPHRDLHDMTAMVAAKILKEMMGRILQDRLALRGEP
ncbi:MAG: agmatinase [Pseudomonadota bacterium]